MKKEVWKPLKDFEKGYEVSSLGRLRSIERIVFHGKKAANRKQKILSLREGKHGYFYTVLSIDKHRTTMKIHRMVASTFIDNKENKPQVNHIDGNKSNNRIDNLEWCTAKENTIHAYSIGLKKGVRGEKSHYSKLKKNDVDEIRKIYATGNFLQGHISKKYNVSQSQIYRIVNRINWK